MYMPRMFLLDLPGLLLSIVALAGMHLLSIPAKERSWIHAPPHAPPKNFHS